MKKILVLCDYGQTRSVAMAHVLRQRGHFAVAGSYENYNKGLIGYNWAILEHAGQKDTERCELTIFDKILFMQEGGEHYIDKDEYNDCTHPELLQKCEKLADELGL